MNQYSFKIYLGLVGCVLLVSCFEKQPNESRAVVYNGSAAILQQILQKNQASNLANNPPQDTNEFYFFVTKKPTHLSEIASDYEVEETVLLQHNPDIPKNWEIKANQVVKIPKFNSIDMKTQAIGLTNDSSTINPVVKEQDLLATPTQSPKKTQPIVKTETTPKPQIADKPDSTKSESKTSKSKPNTLSFNWPVDKQFKVIKNFQSTKTLSPNVLTDGYQFLVPVNSSIRAVADGEVLFAGDELAEYGKIVVIQHNPKIATVYAFNNTIKVQVGQKVKQGQIIALSGLSLIDKKPLLHFEVWENGIRINPDKFLN